MIPSPVPSLTSVPSFCLWQLCCTTQALAYIFLLQMPPHSLLPLFLIEAAVVSEHSNDLQFIGHIFTKPAFKIHHSLPCPSSTSNSNQSCCVKNMYQLSTVLKSGKKNPFHTPGRKQVKERNSRGKHSTGILKLTRKSRARCSCC